MKKLVLGLLLVIAVAYSITWNIAANHIKSDTETFLADLNKRNDVAVTYDKISMAGFPLRIGSSIQGLKIRIATGKFLNSIPESYLNSAFPTITPKDFEILSSLEHHSQFTGSVDVTSNLCANNVRVKFGNGKIVSRDISGEKAINATGDTFYTIQFKHADVGTLFNKTFRLFNSSELSMRDIQSVKFKGKNNQITDENNHALFSSKLFLFSLRYTPLDHNQADYHLIAKEKDAKTTNDYNSWLNGLESYRVLFKLIAQEGPLVSPDTINMNIDIHARLPSLDFFSDAFHWTLASTASVGHEAFKTITIDIQKLDYTSSNLNYSVSGKSSIDLDPDQDSFISLHGYTQYSEEGYQKYLESTSKSIYANLRAQYPGQQYLTQDQIKSLLPRLHEFGKIAFDIEAKKNKDGYRIDQLNFATSPYSVLLKANNRQSNTTVNLKIKHHEPLIHDAVNYLKHAVALLSESKIIPFQKIKIAEDLDPNLLNIVRNISDGPVNNDQEISITIKKDDKGVVTAGKLSPDQTQQQFQKLEESIKIIPSPDDIHRAAQIIEEIETNARKGDKNAQMVMGVWNLRGENVPVDYTEARHWFELAAQKNMSSANNNLGLLYAQGKGVPKNIATARQYFEKATVLGSHYAKINLENLTSQKGYPALITELSPYQINITCEKYTNESIDNLIDTERQLDIKAMSLIEPGKPDAIPENLRAYTRQKAAAAGIKVTN